jgi:hypothetical protein
MLTVATKTWRTKGLGAMRETCAKSIDKMSWTESIRIPSLGKVGALPRPCIRGNLLAGSACGWPRGANDVALADVAYEIAHQRRLA